MKYVATINVPGYLPMDDEPAVFDTPGDAWAYLRDERERGEDSVESIGDDEPSYSDTYFELRGKARVASVEPRWAGACDTVYGGTPGSDSPHDLGLAYSVDVTDEYDADSDTLLWYEI